MFVKLCECGCGQPAPLAKITSTRAGHVKGQPQRFVAGHQTRGKTHPPTYFKHGQGHGTPEYRTYTAAKQRCTNPKVKCWMNYGGRGIEFRFPNFEAFFAELGPRPSPAHSLDRYPNNDGHYEPGNVRWATMTEQAYNRRRPTHGWWSRPQTPSQIPSSPQS